MRGGVAGERPAEIPGTRGTRDPGSRSGYLARLGGGCQARVNPVVAPYGYHAGADFVTQLQREHRQQHDGGGSGEEGSPPEACVAEPASHAVARGSGNQGSRSPAASSLALNSARSR